jgi:hypothetical protein
MYSDKQFADEICRIVDPKDVYTGAQIIQLVEEKFTSTNTRIAQALREIAAGVNECVSCIESLEYIAAIDALRRVQRQLRALQ